MPVLCVLGGWTIGSIGQRRLVVQSVVDGIRQFVFDVAQAGYA